MTIDELEGAELAADVAVAQGLKYWKDFEVTPVAWWAKADGTAFCTVAKYRPDRDIAQAWELDGEGWGWVFDEIVNNHLLILVEKDGRRSVIVTVKWADFPTKSAAYATARCRAFLKAKAAR